MLKELLKANANARKVFGRKELEITIKQLDGVKLSQSERNRLSRDIKPKFEFIREAAKFEGEFRLARNQDNKRVIKKAVDVILNDEFRDDISAILLFGSFADNS